MPPLLKRFYCHLMSANKECTAKHSNRLIPFSNKLALMTIIILSLGFSKYFVVRKENMSAGELALYNVLINTQPLAVN